MIINRYTVTSVPDLFLLFDPLLQYFAEVVGRQHVQLAANMYPCAVDVILLLVQDGASFAQLFTLQYQLAFLTLGSR